MDEKALDIVNSYIYNTFNKKNYHIFIVWKCKVLQNWKYLISTTMPDGMYYELTFNGDTDECYLDAYKKFENRVIHI